ncbi:hypothetical protein MJO29_006029 [Puccinia striiformis f. sp. tritici]|nr:hypothetical protein MJO29_006029 [Puccinia striiformis f. sp. tritici]
MSAPEDAQENPPEPAVKHNSLVPLETAPIRLAENTPSTTHLFAPMIARSEINQQPRGAPIFGALSPVQDAVR